MKLIKGREKTSGNVWCDGETTFLIENENVSIYISIDGNANFLTCADDEIDNLQTSLCESTLNILDDFLYKEQN